MLISNTKLYKQINMLITVISISLILTCASAQLEKITNGSPNDQTQNPKKTSQFPSFDQYVSIYRKPYQKGSDQYKSRQEIYKNRIEILKNMQNDPTISHDVGVNRFSDYTQEQRNRRKPLQVDENSRKTYTQQPQRLAQTSGAPSSLDWRQRGVITSIKDQGECGSCWTFATAAYGQSRLVLKNQSTLNIDLSEQYLLSCTPECTCEGGYLQYVFQKAAGGVPLQSDYPYSPYLPTSPFICWTGKKTYFGYIPKKMYDLNDGQMISLLQNGPVAIGISGTNWQDYKGGVFKCNRRDKINHAVLLVGYTPDYWIVKNQWGTDWGEAGFIRVSRNLLNNCGIGVSAFVMWQDMQHFFFLLFAMILIFIN